MSRKSRTHAESRRAFLKSLAVAGGATAAITMAGKASASQDAGTDTAPAAASGYHETPHIRAYYRKARL